MERRGLRLRHLVNFAKHFRADWPDKSATSTPVSRIASSIRMVPSPVTSAVYSGMSKLTGHDFARRDGKSRQVESDTAT